MCTAPHFALQRDAIATAGAFGAGVVTAAADMNIMHIDAFFELA